jgi:hypothetical protein
MPKVTLQQDMCVRMTFATFDNVRHWAYKAIREYWRPDYGPSWEYAVLARCEAINMGYDTPMQYSEMKSIARSIAKWTMRHFTPVKFSESQARKGGGRPSIGEPWLDLGISRATYFRKKKAGLL